MTSAAMGAAITLGTIGFTVGAASAAPNGFPPAGRHQFASKAACDSHRNDSIRDYRSAKAAQDAKDEQTRKQGKLPPYRGAVMSAGTCSGAGKSWSYEISYPS